MDMGIRIALDDFGTGYSSLSHIRDLAVDRIKIDRTFVQSATLENGPSLLQAIIALGRANGLAVTGEGVETAAQRDMLLSMGCDELQGYLLAMPLPAETITALSKSDGKVLPFAVRRAA